MHVFFVLARLPAVWSSTSLCVTASVVARQQLIWLRLRGPRAHAPAVSSTSARAARRLSTARPPAELCSLDPTLSPPRRPRSYQEVLAVRGTSGACDRSLLRFYSLTILSGWIFVFCTSSHSSTSNSGESFYKSSVYATQLCYIQNSSFTKLNQLAEALV